MPRQAIPNDRGRRPSSQGSVSHAAMLREYGHRHYHQKHKAEAEPKQPSCTFPGCGRHLFRSVRLGLCTNHAPTCQGCGWFAKSVDQDGFCAACATEREAQARAEAHRIRRIKREANLEDALDTGADVG